MSDEASHNNDSPPNARLQAKLASFQSSWVFDRSLSIEMLSSLTQEELLWTPGKKLGSFWKQFRHMGRVQENYLAAIDTRKVDFSTDGASFGGRSITHPEATADLDKQALLDYLQDVDLRLTKRLAAGPLPETIDWFGEPVGLAEHLFRLSSHETLHHGQWIVYCQILGRPFPKSWSIWGLH